MRVTAIAPVQDRSTTLAVAGERWSEVGRIAERWASAWVVVVQVTAASVAPTASAGEVGDVSSVNVVVTFSAAIVSPANDYISGVTILVNGGAATMASASLQSGSQQIIFTLASAVDANDVLTFAYSAATGDWEAVSGGDVANISAITLTNNVGAHLYFDEAADAVHWMMEL